MVRRRGGELPLLGVDEPHEGFTVVADERGPDLLVEGAGPVRRLGLAASDRGQA